MNYYQQHQMKMALRDRIQARLIAVSKERDKRMDFVPEPSYFRRPGQEFAWIAHERAVMHALVNEERARVGKAPIPESEIARVTQYAVGHSDYGSKLALYCSELVLDQHPIQP